MSTLLLYRLLEMIGQRRLSRYNLFVSNMEYESIKINTKRMPEWVNLDKQERVSFLKEKVMDIKQQVFGKPGNGYLPDQVSLLEGFMVLAAFNDPSVQDKSGSNIVCLKRMRSMVYLRNNSIFAHGLGPVSKDDFSKFKEFVKERFYILCMIEKISFKQYLADVKLINPTDSKNYSIGMGEY